MIIVVSKSFLSFHVSLSPRNPRHAVSHQHQSSAISHQSPVSQLSVVSRRLSYQIQSAIRTPNALSRSSSFLRNECPIINHQSAIIQSENPQSYSTLENEYPLYPPHASIIWAGQSKTTRYGGGKYSNFFRYEERISPLAFSSQSHYFSPPHRFYRLGQAINLRFIHLIQRVHVHPRPILHRRWGYSFKHSVSSNVGTLTIENDLRWISHRPKSWMACWCRRVP